MGMFSFIRDAGEKVFGGKDLNEKEIREHILAQGLQLKPFNVVAVQTESKVFLSGYAASIEDKEKAIITAGNIDGVEIVEDRLKLGSLETAVEVPAAEVEAVVLTPEEEPNSRFHTVKSGNTLSGISKEVYGDAMKYPVIFEANKPMLTHPDKIYPGQVLRIPAL